MIRRWLLASGLCLFAVVGCTKVEGPLKYEYDGRLLKTDGKTPVNNATVRLARANAPEKSEAPDVPAKYAKKEKIQRSKTNKDGRYHGTLELPNAWGYTDVSGMTV